MILFQPDLKASEKFYAGHQSLFNLPKTTVEIHVHHVSIKERGSESLTKNLLAKDGTFGAIGAEHFSRYTLRISFFMIYFTYIWHF